MVFGRLESLYIKDPQGTVIFCNTKQGLVCALLQGNDITRIFHNRKLDFPSNFSTSNLVVIVVFLAIALILIVDNLSPIKQ